MAWIQVKSFNIQKMGRKNGWCLQNCRLGFGIMQCKYSSAKEDMEAQKKGGTLHDMTTLPLSCAVPVYVDSVSKYEHVVVCDCGIYYSDGRKVNKPAKVYGWGELCDGVRVVKWVEDIKKLFLPNKGYWCEGDDDQRIGKLAEFMYKVFPAYTNRKALGNYYGKYLKASIKEFQRRTNLKPIDGCVGKKTYEMLKKYGFNG